MLGLEAESSADRPRPVDVRDVRRLLLPRPRDRRRRRRRLGRRGGDVPHQVRRQGHARSTAATSCGRSKIMQDRAFANPKIEFLWNHTVTEIHRRPHGRRASRSRQHVDGSTSTLPVTGLFVAIGHRPNTDLFEGVLDMDDNGYLITQPGSTLHQRRRRVRLRRRAGPHLPPGDHRRRLRLHGGDRRRALARSRSHA